MGYDVGAYRTITKEKVMIPVFQIKEIFEPKREDVVALFIALESEPVRRTLYDEKFFYHRTSHSICEPQNEKTLSYYQDKAKNLVSLIEQNDADFSDNEFVKWIIAKTKEGYGLGRDYMVSGKPFCFDRLEDREHTHFIEDECLDTIYPNSEIPRALQNFDEQFQTNLFAFLINEEELYFSVDAEKTEKLISECHPERALAILNAHLAEVDGVWTPSVLQEVQRLWQQGAYLTYNI